MLEFRVKTSLKALRIKGFSSSSTCFCWEITETIAHVHGTNPETVQDVHGTNPEMVSLASDQYCKSVVCIVISD